MTEEDEELLREYTRFRRDETGLAVDVAVITWNVQRPERSWVEALRLQVSSSATEQAQALQELLSRPEFFIVCEECSRRLLKGHTSSGVCHRCLERNHGVVF